MDSGLKEILIFVFILFGLIVFGTVLKSLYLNPTGAVISNQTDSEKIIILNHEMKNDSYDNLVVSGIAENTVGRDLRYVEIKVRFYDSEGNVLKTTSESINDLRIGEKWKFESIYPSFDTRNVDNYELVVGEVW